MTASPRLRLGTRGSQLALYQAHAVERLLASSGGPGCEIVIIKTSGDRLQDAPLSEAGGKRLFVKEIEDALLADAIDLAVHSSKDMPAVLPEGLTVAGVLPREDPRDAVVRPRPVHGSTDRGGQSGIEDLDGLLGALGHSPVIATSSVRRVAQLSRLMPGAHFEPIRGNLDTRLRKLDEGRHQALVLAAAGLRRLGFHDRISFALPVDVCVPAPGQGIIAVECRADDHAVRAAVQAFSDRPAETAFAAERALVEALGGGCQIPLGALATSPGSGMLNLVGVVVSLDGRIEVRASASGDDRDAPGLGALVAEQLMANGAGALLDLARERT